MWVGWDWTVVAAGCTNYVGRRYGVLKSVGGVIAFY
jgi:hypothetical protein